MPKYCLFSEPPPPALACKAAARRRAVLCDLRRLLSPLAAGGLIGIVAALVAHRLFVAKAWNGKLPLQLSVCCAIGMVVAVLFWTLATR